MIFDKISHLNLYNNLPQQIVNALKFLKDTDFSNVEDGKHTIDGDNMFYIVQHYATKPLAEGLLESHKKYIDVQYLVSGEETFGYALIDNLVVAEPYIADKDIMFYHLPKEITTIHATKDTFCIFFPHDAHLPCRYISNATTVHKVVVKIQTN